MGRGGVYSYNEAMIKTAINELRKSPYYVVFLDGSSNRTTVVRVKDYSEEEFQAFKEARDAIDKNILKFNDLFLMVDQVYQNLLDAYDKKVEAVANEGNIVVARDDLVELNAYFTSFIANVGMYLACVPRAIGSARGEILEGHKKATNIEYDNNFAYRLIVNLRNYALHNTPPITGTRGSSYTTKNGKRGSKYEIYIEKKEIVKDTFVAKKMADDFKSTEEHYPVIENVNSTVESLNNIHWKTIKILLGEVEQEIEQIRALKQLTKDKQPFIAEFLPNSKTNVGLDAQLHLIPTHILEMQDHAQNY